MAVISGGATVIGDAAWRLCAAEGAKAGMETLTDIERSGGKACFVQADVLKADEVARAVAQVRFSLGPIIVLFNHAGSIVNEPFL